MFRSKLVIVGGILLLCCSFPVFSSAPEIAEDLFQQAEKLVNTDDMPSEEVRPRVGPTHTKTVYFLLYHAYSRLK
eukprot:1957232-Pyramimonas_sp.AAC.2